MATPRLIRSFAELFPLLAKGNYAAKVDAALTDALETLAELPGDGKGTATITMTITINADDGRVDIRPAVKSKLPEEKGFASTPFWTRDGALSTQHPSQFDMFVEPRVAHSRDAATA